MKLKPSSYLSILQAADRSEGGSSSERKKASILLNTRDRFKEMTPGRKPPAENNPPGLSPGRKESEELVVRREGEKESQVVWQDPEEAEEMRLAVSRMSTGSEVLEMETMGSLNIDNLTANMVQAEEEKENLPVSEERTKVFLVSGLEDLTSITERLGRAEMRSSGEYDSLVTHIVINKVSRSEKLLCCTAGGKWVLHPQYVTDCDKVGLVSVGDVVLYLVPAGDRLPGPGQQGGPRSQAGLPQRVPHLGVGPRPRAVHDRGVQDPLGGSEEEPDQHGHSDQRQQEDQVSVWKYAVKKWIA